MLVNVNRSTQLVKVKQNSTWQSKDQSGWRGIFNWLVDVSGDVVGDMELGLRWLDDVSNSMLVCVVHETNKRAHERKSRGAWTVRWSPNFLFFVDMRMKIMMVPIIYWLESYFLWLHCWRLNLIGGTCRVLSMWFWGNWDRYFMT